ncbi:hypothetical protein E2C01_049900 [Portunus trituberculatus]|uniref:Uncharacterized protein n=1 Tax=Portunus trituberculatus TaxID=210409 RepID=A0A5B7GAP0_PORTR|nr:hypothetical protein [Portunus trituberculatus]
MTDAGVAAAAAGAVRGLARVPVDYGKPAVICGCVASLRQRNGGFMRGAGGIPGNATVSLQALRESQLCL